MFINNDIIWRVVSWKNIPGGMAGFSHRQYAFDDLVSTDIFSDYVCRLEKRGIETFKAEKQGTLESVLENNLRPKPRPGAKRMSWEKKNHKLEDFQESITSDGQGLGF